MQTVSLNQHPNNQLPGNLQSDQELLNQASFLMELMETQGWERYLKPFLLNLAQEGYPKPTEYQDKSRPNEALILAYTQKVGETEAVKKIFDFLGQQAGVAETIKAKDTKKNDYAIGQDDSFDELRETIKDSVLGKAGEKHV